MKKEIKGISDTRERILTAAKVEFAEKGFDGARMGSIAKRAEANQALIHYYFESKENLYVEVLHRLLGVNLSQIIHDTVEKLRLGPAEGLYAAIYVIVNSQLETGGRDYHRILSREVAEGGGHLDSILQQYIMPRLNLIEGVIKQGIESGIFECKNPFLAVMGILSLVITYESNRDKFRGTEWDGKLYGGGREMFLDFVLEYTFKGLSKAGRPVEVPKIGSDVIKALEALVEEIKKQHI
ncbi:MAG: TetR/AcrR family transcriptional regulator [Spirochaetes bacterium]|jgi:AcrR family transcriptional regulator|nr:TetR/AcrR family transcriptional regulator [Spirochaetota bacterium]